MQNMQNFSCTILSNTVRTLKFEKAINNKIPFFLDFDTKNVNINTLIDNR